MPDLMTLPSIFWASIPIISSTEASNRARSKAPFTTSPTWAQVAASERRWVRSLRSEVSPSVSSCLAPTWYLRIDRCLKIARFVQARVHTAVSTLRAPEPTSLFEITMAGDRVSKMTWLPSPIRFLPVGTSRLMRLSAALM